MLELSVLVWILSSFFAFVGWVRGWTKAIISLAGIILGLFALYEFDALIRESLFGDLPPDQKFYLQTLIFLVIVFFAYQTRALVGIEALRARRDRPDGRDVLQSRVLGGLVGFLNGYLIFGSIWYFLDINRTPTGNYPLAPYIVAPPPGSASAQLLESLPLTVLTQGGTNNDLLAFAVVISFIVVLILI